MYQNIFFAKKKYQSIYKIELLRKITFFNNYNYFLPYKIYNKTYACLSQFSPARIIFLLLLYSRCSELSTTLDHNFYFTWY